MLLNSFGVEKLDDCVPCFHPKETTRLIYCCHGDQIPKSPEQNKPGMNMIVNHLITRSDEVLQVGRWAGHQIDTKTTRLEFKG